MDIIMDIISHLMNFSYLEVSIKKKHMDKKNRRQEISHVSFVLVLEPLMQCMAVKLQCSF